MEKLLEYMTPELLQLVGIVVVFLIGYFKVGDRIKGKKYEAALMILKDATMETYNNFVRDLKQEKSQLGRRLTVEEKKAAMDRTIKGAKSMAMSRGIDLAKALGSAYLPGIVEEIISHEKAKAKVSKQEIAGAKV
jgi:hypothetical protein